MRYCLTIILSLWAFSCFAQRHYKEDTIYYLIDTAKTPVKERMWDISADNIYKYYTIQCPCLKYDGKPTFFYDIEGKDSGTLIRKKKLKAIKLVNLSFLILKSKQIENNDYRNDYHIFLIEPKEKIYVMHEVSFVNPAIHIVSPPDVIERKK